jgi:signal transduction histidine kinase
VDQGPESGRAAGSSEAQLRFIAAALDAAKAGVIVVESDGRIAFANEEGRALMTACTLSTLAGRRLRQHELPLGRALATGRAHEELLVREGADGSVALLRSEANPIRDHSGVIVGAVGTFVDAVPRDLVQALDEAPVGVAVVRGPELIYEYVNGAFQAIAPGIPLVGRPFGVASSDRPELLERLREVWRTGETWRETDLPLTIERARGMPAETAYFSFVCQKVHRLHPPDALLGFVIETTDFVHTSRRLDEALEAARRRAAELEAVIDTMLEGVVAYDSDRRIRLVNATARRMFARIGVPPEMLEHVGQLVRSLKVTRADGSPLPLTELPVSRALAGHACRVNLRFWNQAAQRHGWATIGGAPIRDGNGKVVGVVSVGSDVTEETELDRLKDEFIRVIAHELKTPITIMKGYAQALAQTLGPALSAVHLRMLQGIGRGVDRMNRILCELLDAQQIDLGLFGLVNASVDLRALVEDAVDQVAAGARRHRVHVVASQAVAVRGDAERLREIMRILLDNAVRYSPDGGDIDVALELVDGKARITVRDHGVGIPPDRRDRLFQRFYRAHTGTPHDYGGTGLGLYVARHIAERHGGTIRYDAAEGGGSMFTVDLPVGGQA